MRSFLISTAIIFCILQNSFLVGDDLTEIIPDAERQALIALYKSTNGDRWKNHDNWLGPSGSECTWSGIHCAPDVSTQGEVHWHVYGIDLLKNNLVGTLPSEFDNLG
jgi:hypothetical protein